MKKTVRILVLTLVFSILMTAVPFASADTPVKLTF